MYRFISLINYMAELAISMLYAQKIQQRRVPHVREKCFSSMDLTKHPQLGGF